MNVLQEGIELLEGLQDFCDVLNGDRLPPTGLCFLGSDSLLLACKRLVVDERLEVQLQHVALFAPKVDNPAAVPVCFCASDVGGTFRTLFDQVTQGLALLVRQADTHVATSDSLLNGLDLDVPLVLACLTTLVAETAEVLIDATVAPMLPVGHAAPAASAIDAPFQVVMMFVRPVA